MIPLLLKIFLAGWAVLLVAILLNLIAVRLEIITWYPFIENIEKTGFVKAFRSLNSISKLFLLVIYPLILGFTGYFALKLFIK